MTDRPTPPKPVSQQLREIGDALEEDGYDVRRLRELQEAVDRIRRPPNVIGRLRNSFKQTTKQQWTLLREELAESKEAVALARSALAGRRLDDTERDKLKSQITDLLKMLPASVVAAANTAIPLPGMALLTPWLLRKLSLLPSRWREAHLLAKLQEEHRALLESGRSEGAKQVLLLKDEVERVQSERRSVDRDLQLLAHWDANQNGAWDDVEREAYRAEVSRLKQLAVAHRHSRRWFLSTGGEVFGPVRLDELRQQTTSTAPLETSSPRSDATRPFTLLCYDGRSGWVALSDVLG